MTDYYRLITRTIADLGSTDHARRAAVYECARAALENELCGLTGRLTESEITRERLSLEAAIREIEARMTSRTETACSMHVSKTMEEEAEQSSAPRHPNPPATSLGPHGTDWYGPESKRENPAPELPSLTEEAVEALNVFRGYIAEADRLSEAEVLTGNVSDHHEFGFKPKIEPQKHRIPDRHGLDETAELKPRQDMRLPRSPMPEREPAEAILPGPGGFRKVLAFLGVFLAAALVVVLYWHRHQGAPITAHQHADRLEPEILGNTGSIAKPALNDQQPVGRPQEPVVQRAVLYEEDPGDVNGKPYFGSVIWRTEVVSPGQPLAVRAELEIPERRMRMSMLLRPDTDATFLASHAIDILFELPADFPFGRVSNVVAMLMKEAEQTPGEPLALSA